MTTYRRGELGAVELTLRGKVGVSVRSLMPRMALSMAGTGGCANETSLLCVWEYWAWTAGGCSGSERVGEVEAGGERDGDEVATL